MARELNLRYPGTCDTCGTRIPKGTRALWTGRGHVEHLDCDGAATDTASTVTIDGIDCISIGDGLYRTVNHGEVVARTRYGLRRGYEHTGQRCEDAPCCGCC